MILKEHCIKTGEVLEVKGQPPLRIVEHVKLTTRTVTGHNWEWEPVLEFDRERRT